jgi:chemotaxis protein methyltransferase CheR
MTVAEAPGANADVKVIASDIDTKVLATAGRGVYAIDSRGLSPERQRRHFLRGTGANGGFMRVKPELAKLIEFRPLNLMDARWSLGEPFDIVFCRNVMIYFDNATQRRVLGQIHSAMKPKGLMYVGHSENFTDQKDSFRLRGKTIYERVCATPPSSRQRTEPIPPHAHPSHPRRAASAGHAPRCAQGQAAQARRGVVVLLRRVL